LHSVYIQISNVLFDFLFIICVQIKLGKSHSSASNTKCMYVYFRCFRLSFITSLYSVGHEDVARFTWYAGGWVEWGKRMLHAHAHVAHYNHLQYYGTAQITDFAVLPGLILFMLSKSNLLICLCHAMARALTTERCLL